MQNPKIKGIGFEIEAEMSSNVIAWLKNNGVVKGDGSIALCDKETFCGNANKGNLRALEYNSYVYKRREINSKVKKFFMLLQEEYENGSYHFNKSMGFHIHISFEPQKPTEILSAEFRKFFIDKLKATYKDVVSSRGKNSFCKIKDREIASAKNKLEFQDELVSGYERYQAINFATAMSTHGTIEFRIYPSSEPKKMFEYLVFTINTIEEFLKTIPNMEMVRTLELDYSKNKKIVIADFNNDNDNGGTGLKLKSRRWKKFYEVIGSLRSREASITI